MISSPFAQQFKQWVKGNGVELNEYDRGFIAKLNAQKSGTITQGMDFKTIYADYDKVSTATKELAENNKYLGRTFTDLGKGITDLGDKSSSLGARFIKLGKSLGSSIISGLMSAGVMIAVSAIVSGIAKTIDQAIHKQEHLREASAKLTQQYQQDASEIKNLTSQYEELNKKFHDSALSAEEYEIVKSQLISVQEELASKYDYEAEKLDLVNGKYEEQIGIIERLSQRKAQQFVTENHENIQADMKYLNGQIGMDIGTGGYYKDYQEYASLLKKYNIELYAQQNQYNPDKNNPAAMLRFSGTRKEMKENLEKAMYELLDKYGEENKEAYKLYTMLKDEYNDSIDIEQYETSDTNIREYSKARIFSDKDRTQAYNNVTDAITRYNEALSAGKDVEDASSNYEQVVEEFNKLTNHIEGANDVLLELQNNLDKKAYFKFEIQSKVNPTYGNQDYQSLINKELDDRKFLLQDHTDALLEEYQKIQDWGLSDYQNEIMNQTIQSKFGNIDMDKRTIITWSDELKETYKDALDSWNYDPEVGTIDTVFGGSLSTNEDLGLTDLYADIAFTPIMVDKDGKNSQFLDADTVTDYLKTIIAQAQKNLSNTKYTQLDLFNEILRIDAQEEGTKVGDQFIHGLIGAISNESGTSTTGYSAIDVGKLLHFSGKYGTIQIDQRTVDDIISQIGFFDILKNKGEEKSLDYYLNQLKDSTDTDLLNTNWLDEETSNFEALCEILDVTQEQAEDLINALVELGYVQSEYDLHNKEILKEKLGVREEGSDAVTYAAHNNQINDFVNNISSEDRQLMVQGIVDAKIDIDRNYTTKQLYEILTELRREANKEPIKIPTSIEVTSGADGVKSAMTDLQTALDDYQNNGLQKLDISNLTKLNNEDTFGNINESTQYYEDFLDVMTNINSTAEEVQAAFDVLASNYLYHSELAQQITADNKDWVVSELEKNGVLNAQAVAEQMLINKEQGYIQNVYGEMDAVSELVAYHHSLGEAKYSEADASAALENATQSELLSMITEANAAGQATGALQQLLAAKLNVPALTTDGDVANLSLLCKALGIAGSAVERYSSIKEQLASGHVPSGASTALIEEAKGLERYIESAIRGAISGGTRANTVIRPGGYYTPSGGSGGGGGGGSDSAKDFSEEYDWIAVGIQRCTEAIERLAKVESNTFEDWSKRNQALNGEIEQTTRKITFLQAAYKGYMNAADSVGLSEEYKKKVREGKIQIETIKDEKLKEQIERYKSFYESAMSAKDAIDDMNISLSELAKKKFDNIVKQFEDIRSIIQGTINILDSATNLATARGYLIGKTFYQNELAQEQENYKQLIKQREAMIKQLQESVDSGKIKYQSEAWYELYNKIVDVNKQIVESQTNMQNYANSIRQVDWTAFDMVQDKISEVNTELEFYSKLLESKELTDGKKSKGLTKYGNAQMGAYAIQYNLDMQKAENYKKEIKKIDNALKNDPTNQDLLKRRAELVKLQQDAITNAQAEKKAMIDLARQGYDAILNSLQEMINKRKELLQTEKDLYDYQQSVAEKTENIANIQKQLDVYSNDNSEESRRKVQELQNQLKEAQKDLDATKREKQISDQTEALDKMYEDYSNLVDDKFKDTDSLIAELIKDTNNNSASIKSVINSIAKDVDIKLSESLKTILNGDTIVSNFHKAFELDNTTITTAIGNIGTQIDAMILAAEQEAKLLAYYGNLLTGDKKNTDNIPAKDKDKVDPDLFIDNSKGDFESSGSGSIQQSGYTKKDYKDLDMMTGRDLVAYAKSLGLKVSDRDAYIIINHKTNDGSFLPPGGYVSYEQTLKERITKKRGYRTGTKRLTDGFAWTNEDGESELIRTSDGALLTPVGRGGTVFNTAMSDELWKFASNPQDYLNGLVNLPSVNSISNVNSGQLYVENMVLNDVHNPEDFADKFVSTLKANPNMVKSIQSVTTDLAIGKSIKKLNRF